MGPSGYTRSSGYMGPSSYTRPSAGWLAVGSFVSPFVNPSVAPFVGLSVSPFGSLL